MKRKNAWSLFLLIMLLFCRCGDNSTMDPVYETGTLTDIEGNVYQTIKIGDQWWMAENLRTATFRDGELVPNITDNSGWKNTTSPAYSSYNNSSTGTGFLYNYYIILSENEIAPEGWHVPTDEDWKILEEYIGLSISDLDQTNWRGTNEGDKLKEETTNTTGWIRYGEVWGTNETGFNAVGGSCRVFNGEWGVPGLRHSGFWWTSSTDNGYGWYRYLDYKKSGIFRYSAEPNYGFSIRCVKN